MKQHVFRLHHGDDLRQSIEACVKEKSIRAGYIACCVGCLCHARLRDASGVAVREWDERLEIVSVTGTVSMARCHVHVSLAREDSSVLGGHLLPGCIVDTTAEVVLGELDGVAFGAEFDEQTGYDELVIQSVDP